MHMVKRGRGKNVRSHSKEKYFLNYVCNIQMYWCLKQHIISVLGPISWMIFHHSSNSMEISIGSHQTCSEMITMKLCSWHDSCVVGPCAKFYSNKVPYNAGTLKSVFHRIWIMMKKIVGELGPCYNVCQTLTIIMPWQVHRQVHLIQDAEGHHDTAPSQYLVVTFLQITQENQP